MKKIIFTISLFFINILGCNASAYLENLEVSNYNLSPAFDKYNSTYTININKEDTTLDLNYVLEDENSEVEILGNDLITESEQEVLINVVNNEEKQTYKIIVNKNDEETVMNYDDMISEVNISKPFYKKTTIACICLSYVILMFLFKKLLFRRAKK